MEDEVANVFNESQFTTASHQKLILSLYGMLNRVNYEEFRDIIIRILNRILQIDFKNADNSIEKVMMFFTSFLSYAKLKSDRNEDGDCVLLNDVIKHLLKTLLLAKHIIRYRSCKFISNLFDKLAEQSLHGDLLEEIQDALLDRASDPKVDVRVQALIALYRLQNPDESKHPVIEQYISSIYDTSPKVRKVAVEKIAIRRDVIEHIVGRTRDVDVKVRLAAFTKLSKLVQVLNISQRQLVLKAGAVEDNTQIKQYVANKMIVSWFELYNYDCLEIIKALRLDGDEKDIANTVQSAEFLLNCIFKTHTLKEILNALPIDENNTITFERLNWETIILWRFLTQYLRQSNKFDEVLNEILPDLVVFCDYIQNYCQWKQPNSNLETDYLEHQFILEQLLVIASDYDIGDVVARRTLIESIKLLLQTVDLNVEVVNVAMKILEKCMENVENRCRFVCEIISEIVYPSNADDEIPKQDELIEMKNRYQILTLEKLSSETAEDYLQAADCQKQLDELKTLIKNKEEEMNKVVDIEKTNDPDAIKKYLDIAAALLASSQITKLNSTLLTLKQEVIQECLMHPDENVKAKALKCYVFCCMVDQATAKIGLHICAVPIIDYHRGEPCEIPLLTVAIAGVVNMLLIYGFDLLATPEQENLSESMDEQHKATFTGGTSLTTLIQGLADLMTDENLEISVLAVRGLCMLVSYSSVDSPSLISRLILKWANPATDTAEESVIKALIGETLNRLVRHSTGAKQLQKAILPTIRALIRAPKNNPLHKVQSDVIKFLIALCSTAVDNLEIQAELAVSICDLIRRDPPSAFNLAYSEALLLLELPKTDSLISDLLDDCDAILDDVHNKKVCNNIRKFVGKLQKILPEEKRIEKEEEDADSGEEEESDSSSTETDVFEDEKSDPEQ